MKLWREFQGVNAGYVLDLYEQYQHDPQSVSETVRNFFADWSPPMQSPNGQPIAATPTPVATDQIVGAVNLAQAIRGFGHLVAQLDPLESAPAGDPSLLLETHRLTEEDLRQLPADLVGGEVGQGTDNAWTALENLREIYTSHIGYDFDHVEIPEERAWLRSAAESRRYRPNGKSEYAQDLLERLTQIEIFEQFIQQTFPSKYRFSVEGLDMLVPMLDELIAFAAEKDIPHVLMGMAHRGRLNVLAHILHTPYEQIFAEFKDPLRIQKLQDAIGWTVGDVKYHKGTRRIMNSGQSSDRVVLTIPPNSSHLELINPVIMGMARAAGMATDAPGQPSFKPDLTLQILVHGDASFPAQGINAETLNLLALPGYWVGGTVHIIANNQIGFTTLPKDGRSTLYASDLAKGFNIPIVHVNADDPDACLEVTRMAYAYQEKFEKDFLIDLIGYRRYGHNELDEPSFTQPRMYETIRNHPTVRTLWANTLVERGLVEEDEAETLAQAHRQTLQEIYDSLSDAVEERAEDFVKTYQPPPEGEAQRTETAVSTERLQAINESLKEKPAGFQFYSERLERTLSKRREALMQTDEANIDWSTAEELALATILEDGIAIRLTGQDSERGTFSQRHAVWHDAETGEKFTPLQALKQAQASFEIHDSPLSEAAVLAFEYGYNIYKPHQLVIWEAQYGDFINNAQTVIDEYISSAREKWGQTPSLVFLLPHAWEGAGPDHSSGRLERWLQLAAKTNMRVVNCTTAAQYFHVLRRQALLLESDPLPLIIMTPKSLLRHPAVLSRPQDLTDGKWQAVIADPQAKSKAIKRLVLCSGKLAVDLLTSDYRDEYPHVAVVRVEQLYPFPIEPLQTVIDSYPNLQEIIWAQEEPKNMGAWEFMSWRLERLIDERLPVNYVGRRRSSSPAEGSLTAHKTNQEMIIEYAFNYEFEQMKQEKH